MTDDDIDTETVWCFLKEHCFNNDIKLESLEGINKRGDIILVKFSRSVFNRSSWTIGSELEIDMKDYLQKIREDKLSKLLKAENPTC